MISKRSGLTPRRKDQKEMGSSSGEELVIEKALMPAPLSRGEQSDIGVKNVVFSSPKPRDLAPFLNCDIVKDSSYLQQRLPTVSIHFANPAW